jgi:hypothetical protein
VGWLIAALPDPKGAREVLNDAGRSAVGTGKSSDGVALACPAAPPGDRVLEEDEQAFFVEWQQRPNPTRDDR